MCCCAEYMSHAACALALQNFISQLSGIKEHISFRTTANHTVLSQLISLTVLRYLFSSELWNFVKRDLEMQPEADVAKKMLSLMNWQSFFLCQAPLHRSWTRHRLSD